jgi:hypothetical protein
VGAAGSGPLMSPEALAALQQQQEHADRCVLLFKFTATAGAGLLAVYSMLLLAAIHVRVGFATRQSALCCPVIVRFARLLLVLHGLGSIYVPLSVFLAHM